ncbi:alpha-crystallin B chain-like isoform X2 [Aethina tumida]|uniref:alpha-crystallin B chain-like isoform X2 n=1 Tax=Aethina tumida TaxID=116153 RepID=UPI002148D487|nr:alpha-crystallin B chain-like isoform X2 [Aethina tumida]
MFHLTYPRRREIIISPEDIIKPMVILSNLLENGMQEDRKPRQSQQVTQVSRDPQDAFRVSLDVQHFMPEEIKVTLVGDNVIAVECKHEEKGDEHGSISRHFIRKYVIPKEFDMSKVETRLSSDGVLSIIVPKIESSPVEYREIPIIRTDEPVKKLRKNENENEK